MAEKDVISEKIYIYKDKQTWRKRSKEKKRKKKKQL